MSTLDSPWWSGPAQLLGSTWSCCHGNADPPAPPVQSERCVRSRSSGGHLLCRCVGFVFPSSPGRSGRPAIKHTRSIPDHLSEVIRPPWGGSHRRPGSYITQEMKIKWLWHPSAEELPGSDLFYLHLIVALPLGAERRANQIHACSWWISWQERRRCYGPWLPWQWMCSFSVCRRRFYFEF